MKGVQMQQDASTWLGTKETARRLGVAASTVYRLIDTGQLPAYKFGRVLRVKEADIDAFIEGSRIVPGELEHLYTAMVRDEAGGHEPGESDDEGFH